MAGKSKIEWTESTWNPITGCTQISDGCLNCYAKRMAFRLHSMGQEKYRNAFDVTMHPECLEEPLTWKKPQMIFVCSMSDLFHNDVPDDFIKEVFAVMNQAKWHTFQVLTKRSERLRELAPQLNWSGNIWLGVTVESDRYKSRIRDLLSTSAKIKYLSIEPMIDKINNVPLLGIDWVIVGGESGPGARPIQEDWVCAIRDKSLKMNIPFFFKQWGGTNKKQNGSLLQGKYWKQMPKQD